MKTITRKLAWTLFLPIFCLTLLGDVYAQTTLRPGEAAITGFNADGTDQFSVLLLVEVTDGTEIAFTDNGWDPGTGLRTTEGTLLWTNTTGATLPAGTELVFTDGSPEWDVTDGRAAEIGSFILSTSGDQILIYQGDAVAPEFVFGVHFDGSGVNAVWDLEATSAQESALPDGLTDNLDAMALSEKDNYMYTCETSVVTGEAAEILAAIVDINLWDGHNVKTYILAPCTYTVSTSGCGYATGTVSGTNSINNGETTTLTISGSGATSYQWQWKPSGGATWVDCNTNATSSSYTTAYLGQSTEFRAVLSDGSETCYTDESSSYTVTVGASSTVTVWTGQTSTSWTESGNWTGNVPDNSLTSMTYEVMIGNEYANAPAVASGNGDIKMAKLYVQSDATLNKSNTTVSENFIVYTSLEANGTINQTGTRPIELTLGSVSSTVTVGASGNISNVSLTVGGNFDAASNITCNDLTISSGSLDMSTYTLTVSRDMDLSGGTLEMNSGTLDITGDFTNSGGTANGSSGTIRFVGASLQDVTSNNQSFNNVVVNNAAGVRMVDDMEISGALTLTRGVLNTNDNILTMTSTTAEDLSGYSNTNFIKASQDGPFRRHIASNTDIYVFPVGNGTSTSNYFRMDMMNRSLSGNGFTYLDVYVKTNTETGNNVDSRITATEGGTPITNMWDKEWMIIPDNEPSSGNFGIRLYTENISGLEDNKFTVFKRADNSTDYADYGNGVSTSTSIPSHNAAGRTVSSGYAEKTGFEPPMAGTSGGSGDNNLPIQLLDFKADLNEDGGVDLIWTTASEVNNEYFSIERSTDGVDYETVLEREGAGNSNQLIEYAAIDENPLAGTSYYRLKQTDYDGSFEYSELQVVNVLRSLNFSVKPNPATDRLQITFGEIAGGSVFVMTPEYQAKIRIYNIAGKLIYKKKFDGNFYKFNIDVSNFDEGMYLVNLETAGQVYKTKFVKE